MELNTICCDCPTRTYKGGKLIATTYSAHYECDCGWQAPYGNGATAELAIEDAYKQAIQGRKACT